MQEIKVIIEGGPKSGKSFIAQAIREKLSEMGVEVGGDETVEDREISTFTPEFRRGISIVLSEKNYREKK